MSEVPEHVQKVRDMDEDQLLAECNAIYRQRAVEPERTLPADWKLTDNNPED